MSRLGILISLSIVCFGPPFVNAAPGATESNASKQTAKKHRGLTLEEFINKAILEGEDNNLGPNISRILGLEPDHKSKVFEKLEEDCADERYRTADIVIEKVSESDRLKPVYVIFLAKRTRPGVLSSDWFKLQPDGTIEKAFRSSGKLTSDGLGVPGSGVAVDFDPDEAKALLKRELDFWLKGIGLKKKPADKTASGAPGQR